MCYKLTNMIIYVLHKDTAIETSQDKHHIESIGETPNRTEFLTIYYTNIR